MILIIFKSTWESAHKAQQMILNQCILLLERTQMDYQINWAKNKCFGWTIFEKLSTWIDSNVFLQKSFCSESINESIHVHLVKQSWINLWINFTRSKLVFIKLCQKILCKIMLFFKTYFKLQKAFNFYKIGLKIMRPNLITTLLQRN